MNSFCNTVFVIVMQIKLVVVVVGYKLHVDVYFRLHEVKLETETVAIYANLSITLCNFK